MSTRKVGGLTWTYDRGRWVTRHAGRGVGLIKHRPGDGHATPERGWYLHVNSSFPYWAGVSIGRAIQVATLIVLGEWTRTGLRDDTDGRPTWRNQVTGEVLREPDALATLTGRRAPAGGGS